MKMVLILQDILEVDRVYLVLGVATSVFFLFQLVQSIKKRKYVWQNSCQQPPNVVSLGPFGLNMVLEMMKATKEHRFLGLLHNWFHVYGATFEAKMPGRRALFTVEPENIQAMLAHKFDDFDLGENRLTAFRPLLGNGIFSSDGERWSHSRALLRPNFARNQITDIEIYERHVNALIQLIPRDGSTVDLQDLFFRMTLDSATEFLFGESVQSLRGTAASASSFSKDFYTAQEGLAFRFRMGPLRVFYGGKEFSQSVANIRNYVGKFVQKSIDARTALDSDVASSKARRLDEQQYVFLYKLSKETLDKTELIDQLLSILLAGRDTTAGLLSITFFILARRPDIWSKLREQVLNLNGQKPSFEDLKSMTYLAWVLNETLRLYPSVPFNARTANKDTHLPVGGGPDGKAPVFVPKGQDVMYSPFTMHRSREAFGPDADEYKPERWEKARPGWSYLPFNGGPRICIGQQFALTEAGYTMVRILQNFQAIVDRDEEPFEEALTLTLASFNGTKVAMSPVESSGS